MIQKKKKSLPKQYASLGSLSGVSNCNFEETWEKSNKFSLIIRGGGGRQR
jgi:hypothetical protein